jgi:tetratricopeptide (TPR) repeat protein
MGHHRKPVHARTKTFGRSEIGAIRAPSFYAALIVVTGILTYANSIGGPFIFDDLTAIEQNDTIRQSWHHSNAFFPPRQTPVGGRPVVNLSFALNYGLGGLDVVGYHVWNIAVHVACALVLFGIVRRTLLGPRLRNQFLDSANGIAAVSALVWMVHPLLTESVDYVTQRTESMMGLCLLLTLYCAIRARRTIHARRWQTASVLACALGMACKESMAIAPLVVILYDRAFERDSMRDIFRSGGLYYAALAATWIELTLSPRFSVASREIASAAPASLGPPSYSLLDLPSEVGPRTYALNQLEVITQYLRLAAWPRALVIDYGMPRPVAFSDVIPYAFVVGSLIIAAAVAWVRWPRVGFLCVVFVLALAPTSSILPSVTEVGAERRMYVALAALAVLTVIAGHSVLRRQSADLQKPPLMPVGGILAAAVVVSLATRTHYRNVDYATPVLLWRTTVAERPNGRARNTLGILLLREGAHDEAMRNLREAARDYPPAHFILGAELSAAGELDAGVAELRQFITLLPRHSFVPGAEALISRILVTQGKLAEATAFYERALARDPSNADVRGQLADVLFAQNRFDEAIPNYRALLASRPQSAAALNNLGVALAAVGRLDQAIASFEHGVQVDPQSPFLHRYLAQAFLEQGKAHEAELAARDAAGLAPGDPDVHVLLGMALGSEGELEGATDEFRRALQIQPSNSHARDGLARVLRQKLRTTTQRANR